MDKYDNLKLDNQLCFPLYAAAKEIVRKYKPMLDDLNLTYTHTLSLIQYTLKNRNAFCCKDYCCSYCANNQNDIYYYIDSDYPYKYLG